MTRPTSKRRVRPRPRGHRPARVAACTVRASDARCRSSLPAGPGGSWTVPRGWRTLGSTPDVSVRAVDPLPACRRDAMAVERSGGLASTSRHHPARVDLHRGPPGSASTDVRADAVGAGVVARQPGGRSPGDGRVSRSRSGGSRMRGRRGVRAASPPVLPDLAALGLAIPPLRPRLPRPGRRSSALGAWPHRSSPAGARVLRPTTPSLRLAASVFLRPRSPGALAAFAAAVGDEHARAVRSLPRPGEFAAASARPRDDPSVERFVARRRAARRGPVVESSRGARRRHRACVRVGVPNAPRDRCPPSRRCGTGHDAPLELPPAVADTVVAVLGLDDLVAMRSDLERSHAVVRDPPAARATSSPPRRPGPGAPSACASARRASEGEQGLTDDQEATAYGADGLYADGDLGQARPSRCSSSSRSLAPTCRPSTTCYFGADHTPTSRPSTSTAAREPASARARPRSTSRSCPPSRRARRSASTRRPTRPRARSTSTTGSSRTTSPTSPPRRGACASATCCATRPDRSPRRTSSSSRPPHRARRSSAPQATPGNDACAYHDASPTSPVLSVEDPASQPYVVGVGGTTAVTVTQPPIETVWNDGYTAAAPAAASRWSGASPHGCRPRRRRSRRPDAAPQDGRATCRTVPDVSAFADEFTGHHGPVVRPVVHVRRHLVVGSDVGGAARRGQRVVDVPVHPRRRRGASASPRPLLYDVASVPADYASGFTDVTVGDNDIYGVTGGVYRARHGYDLATGLGSPRAHLDAGDVGSRARPEPVRGRAGSERRAGAVDHAGAAGASVGGTAFRSRAPASPLAAAATCSQVDFGTSPAASFTVVSDTLITGTTTAASTPTSRRAPRPSARDARAASSSR